MELELKDDDEKKFYFKPFGLNNLKGKEWEGAWRDVKWLMPWIKPYSRQGMVAFILFITSVLIAVLVPRIVAFIVDEVLLAKKYSFPQMASLLGILVLLKIVSDIAFKWKVTKIGQSISKKLREDVFNQLGSFPLAFFDKNSSGRVISRCVNDVSNLSTFFTANFFSVVSDLAIITGSVIFLFTLSFKAALIVLVAMVPMVIFMLNVSMAQVVWGRSQRNILSRLSSHTADSMNNLAVLHSQTFSSKWVRRHESLQTLFANTVLRNIYVWGSFSSSHVLVMGLTYAAVIILGAHQLKTGDITLGRMIGSFTYVGLIFGPFLDITEKLNALLNALGSVQRLKTILPAKPEAADSVLAASDATMPTGPIVFKNISFSYRSDTNLFKDFNLELPEGEVTALVGRTGSGKTSLAHLLLGLYPLSAGQIKWGEEDLSSFSAMKRARWISHVSQDLFLFTDTLRENLRLWRQEITDDKILERLKLVGLLEKVQSFPGGLDMIVRTETLPLSQGEKQLLLLCRALLQDPRLLVFDEATASLDQLSEEEWLGHVSKLFKGRTTLFIAHRLETLKLASFVVVLENGKIKKTFRKEVGKSVNEDQIH
ncbi:MAG: ABC transporter ATP-binding protein [Bdellovibrionales bacterium]|nr:ABC transporter ATP-binding protein [Bdellovibrionales bacterium]